jgi:hypothetical protein
MRLHPGYSILLGRAFSPQPRTPEVTLADRPTGAGQPKRNLVAEWLRASHLQIGGRSQYSIEVAAQRDGLSNATLRRSKFDLASKAPQMENPAARDWSSPPAEEDQQTYQAAT